LRVYYTREITSHTVKHVTGSKLLRYNYGHS